MTLGFDRSTMLERLRDETFDVLVVGGGITGVGVALDAATRGLRTALVERHDFASGTSSKSSKLVHGGLRYLQNGDVRLVYEALHERSRLMRNAPHLVRLLPFLIPILDEHGLMDARLARGFGSALWAYDLTGGWRVGKFHRRLDTSEALAHLPTLDPSRLSAAYVYFDAHADDARLTLAVARTAAVHGAAVVNHAGVRSLIHGSDGRVTGAIVSTDIDEFEVRAGCVVNATGVWADAVNVLDRRAGDPATAPTLRPAKGVHLTVARSRIGNDIAAVLPVPGDGRSMFLVPDGDLAYIGTTDTDYTGDPDDPMCTPDDVAYVLDAANATLTSGLTEHDVLGSWAGLRPLLEVAGTGKTKDLSRRHRVTTSKTGVVTVTGGKLTTYRRMAADTVDVVVRSLGRGTRSSRTERLMLVGTSDAAAEAATTDPLVARHGTLAAEVRSLAALDPDLARPLVPTLPYLAAEAVHAVRHEMATDLSDVLDRRTRCRIYARDDTADAAADVAAVIGPELGWSPRRQREEADRYRAGVERERATAGLPRTSRAK
ncbi:MAG: glycerol-3-phosphate dehydrogenase/oxidase [Acidimicrobiia bacterium]